MFILAPGSTIARTFGKTTTTITTDNNIVTSESFAGCPSTGITTPWSGTLDAGTNPAVTICFQVYEFNSTAPIVLNTTKLLWIFGFPAPNEGAEFSGVRNFSVSASVAQLSLGGPSNLNEGTTIAYALSAKPGASGTYFMALQGWLLGPEPMACTGGAGQLIAGNGRPAYAIPGSCMLPGDLTSANGFAILGVDYRVISDNLYYRIVGASNSTR